MTAMTIILITSINSISIMGSNDTTRERGILSRADREYLLGESDIEEKSQQERNARGRIRQRVTNAMLDFTLLNRHLAVRDRQMVADALRKAYSEHEEQTWTLGPEHECLVPPLTFCYTLTRNLGAEFSIPLERTIRDVEMGYGGTSIDESERIRDIGVTFEVERTLLPDLNAAKERLESGGLLTDSEIGALLRAGNLTETDIERLRENE